MFAFASCNRSAQAQSVAGPPPFLNEDVDNNAAEFYSGRNRSGQNDNQMAYWDEAPGIELDSLFANKDAP